MFNSDTLSGQTKGGGEVESQMFAVNHAIAFILLPVLRKRPSVEGPKGRKGQQD